MTRKRLIIEMGMGVDKNDRKTGYRLPVLDATLPIKVCHDSSASILLATNTQCKCMTAYPPEPTHKNLS